MNILASRGKFFTKLIITHHIWQTETCLINQVMKPIVRKAAEITEMFKDVEPTCYWTTNSHDMTLCLNSEIPTII